MPRDRAGTFEPVIVKKRQRRLSDVDAVAIILFAKGLTTGEISAHFQEVYGASISKDTVSRITDKVLEEMATWSSRPLQGVYAAIFIDAIYVKVRDGQVANRPIYVALAVTVAAGTTSRTVTSSAPTASAGRATPAARPTAIWAMLILCVPKIVPK